MVHPGGFRFQLFVGREEAPGRAAAVRAHTSTQTHTHTSLSDCKRPYDAELTFIQPFHHFTALFDQALLYGLLFV